MSSIDKKEIVVTQYRELLENTFRDLFNPDKSVEDLKPYFSLDYRQWVDGKTLDYQGFFQHVAALKGVISTAHIEFIEYLEKDDTAADIHDVFVTKKSGEKVHIRVMAFFTFENQQIKSVKELTYLLSGSSENHDLGSRLPESLG